jgi:hypothetical protein
MRDYIDIIETIALNEAIVTNPDDIDKWVKPLIDLCKPEQGKQWLTKKVRQKILNDEGLLVQANPTESELAKMPDYVKKAFDEGKPVYTVSFGSSVMLALKDKLQHIVDWFNALNSVAHKDATNAVEVEDKVIANKELSKLPRYDVDAATKTADAWFNHMGTRIKSVDEQEGARVVARLSGGFYAVEFTSKEGMIRDGKHLQNCLQQGHYWQSVENGSMQVYSIRKANNEAVVGIRIANGKLAEVKGKNNKPVIHAYITPVVEFLNFLKVPAGEASDIDLSSSDIVVSNGRYGTLDDLSTDIGNGVKVLVMTSPRSGNVTTRIAKGDHVLKAMFATVVDIGNTPIPVAVDILNYVMKKDAFDPKMMETFASLSTTGSRVYSSPSHNYSDYQGLWVSQKGYGTVRDVSTSVNGLPKGFEAFPSDNGSQKSYEMYYNGELLGVLTSEGDSNHGGLGNLNRVASLETLAELLNKLAIDPIGANEDQRNTIHLYQRLGLFWTGEKWGTMDVCKPVLEENDETLWYVGTVRKRAMFFVTTDGRRTNVSRFSVYNGKLLDFSAKNLSFLSGTVSGKDGKAGSHMIDYLKKHYRLKSLNGIDISSDAAQMGSEVVTSFDEVVEHLKKNPDFLDTYNDSQFRDFIKFLRVLRGRETLSPEKLEVMQNLLLDEASKKPGVIEGVHTYRGNNSYEKGGRTIDVSFNLFPVILYSTVVLPNADVFRSVYDKFMEQIEKVAKENPNMLFVMSPYSQGDTYQVLEKNQRVSTFLIPYKDKIDALNKAAKENIQSELANKDVDLSSRFAALNAMRKAKA